DRLIGKYGDECPATGFSLGVNIIMQALRRQKLDTRAENTEVLVSYEKGARKKAVETVEEYRKNSVSAELDIVCKGIEYAEEYARSRNIPKVVFVK
ncbi:MAG: ATP phosphoribosyltransferase regulatory subunit, partial [Clostridiales bacterium]|nr:ATP phosphoribosyltransferase regulatory subunit [Clostridiales bacterium]